MEQEGEREMKLRQLTVRKCLRQRELCIWKFPGQINAIGLDWVTFKNVLSFAIIKSWAAKRGKHGAYCV